MTSVAESCLLLGAAQLDCQIEQIVLEIPAVVGCARDEMGDLFQGDMQEPVGQLSDIEQAGWGKIGVNKDRAVPIITVEHDPAVENRREAHDRRLALPVIKTVLIDYYPDEIDGRLCRIARVG